MRDIRERPAVNERGIVLDRLNDVRSKRILEERGHCARAFEIGSTDVLPLASLPDDDVAEPPLEVVKIFGQAEHRHDLRCGDDVESILARETIADPAKRN